MKKEVIIVFLILVNLIIIIDLNSNNKITGSVIENIQYINGPEVETPVNEEINKNNSAEVIIIYKDNIDPATIENKMDGLNAVSANITEEDLKLLKKDDKIEVISIDEKKSILLDDGLSLINASLVHKQRYNNMNLTGISFGICILDTGINYSHSDLGGCLGSTCKVVDGYDFVNSDSNPMDDHGHGTHVAGIASANGSLIGVSPDSVLLAVKVCNSAGLCSDSDILDGMSWCISNKVKYNITVMSMSFGGGSYSDYCDDDGSANGLYSDIINNATSNNITVVVSTGNSGSTTYIGSPACIANSTSVSSINKDETISSFSNRNKITNFMAPGNSINSTYYDGSYHVDSGTSMAAPFVSGSVALLQQYNNLNKNSWLKVNEVKTTFNNTARNVTDSNGLKYPIIDVYQAIESLKDTITLNISYPEDNIYINTNATFNFTIVSTKYSSINCSLNINGVLNQTNSTTINNTLSFFRLNLTDGNYTWNISCIDNSSNAKSSINRNLVIDKNKPLIGDVNYTSVLELGNIQTIKVNVTEINLDHVNISYDNLNRTMYLKDNLYQYNYTPYYNATFNFTIYAYDLAGNFNVSNYTFIVNDTTNNPLILTPELKYSTLTYSTEQTIYALILDSKNIDTAYLALNNINYTMSNSTNYNFSYSFIPSSCTTQSYIIYANNTNGHSTNYSGTFSMNCCGDHSCNNQETCSSCSADCGECSGGGGGGGGGGGSSTKTISSISFTNKQFNEITLAKGDSVTFSLNNIGHTLTINSINQDNIDLTITSTPIKLNLKLQETKRVDLNEDNMDDLSIKLESILPGNKAYLTLKKVENIHITGSVIEEKDKINEKNITITEEMPLVKKETLNKTSVILISVVIILLLFIVFLIWHIHNSRKNFIKGKKLDNRGRRK